MYDIKYDNNVYQIDQLCANISYLFSNFNRGYTFKNENEYYVVILYKVVEYLEEHKIFSKSCSQEINLVEINLVIDKCRSIYERGAAIKDIWKHVSDRMKTYLYEYFNSMNINTYIMDNMIQICKDNNDIDGYVLPDQRYYLSTKYFDITQLIY